MEMHDIEPATFEAKGLANPKAVVGNEGAALAEERMLEDLEDADLAEWQAAHVRDARAFTPDRLQS